MKRAVRHSAFAALAVALALLLAVGSLGFWSARRNADAFRAVERLEEVRYSLTEVLVAVLSMESANRGFAISGDQAFLNAYQDDEADLERSLARVQDLTRDDPEQQRRLAALTSLMQAKTAFMRQTIGLRRGGDAPTAQQRIAIGDNGKPLMTTIRAAIRDLEDAGNNELRRYGAQSRMLFRLTEGGFIFGGFLALVLVGLAALRIRHDLRRRETAELERERFFMSSQDLLCIAHADGHFKRVSPSFTEVLGWSEDELLRRPFIELVHPDDREPTNREVERMVTAGEKVLHFENRYQHKDGSWRWLSWKGVPQPGGFLYASAREVTAEKWNEALQSARADVLGRLASAASLPELLGALIQHVERIYPGRPASILLLDEAGRLHNAATTGLPEFYNAAIEGLAIGPGVGSCGEAAASKQRSVAPDLEVHPNWQPYLDLTRRADLRACWSQPMLGEDGRVLGTFAIYSRKPASPGEADIRLLEEVARIAAIALQRRQAEEALRASEENLAITLRSIGDAVLTTDAQRRVTRMNPIAETLTGWTEAEAQGRPIDDVFRIINEETRQPALIPVDDVLATGEIQGVANHSALIARDGAERSIADSAAPIRDQAGRITGVVLCFHDETKERRGRRAAEQRTAERIAQQNVLLDLRDHQEEALPAFQRHIAAVIADTLHVERVSIWHFDPAQTSIECQNLFIRSTRKHENGLRLAAADYPSYFKAVGNRESVLADDARTHPATSEFASGYLDPLGITSMLDVPVRLGGRLVGVLCCEHVGPARQWTAEENRFAVSAASFLMLALERDERRKAEEALRASEENLAITLRSIGDAVLATDAQRRVTRMNPIAETLTGWTEAEAQGRPIDDVFRILDEKTRQPAVIPVDDVLATGEIQGLTSNTALIARDGTERSIAENAAPIRDSARRIVGVVLVFRDVTREREAEEQLRASEAYNRSIVESGQDCLKVLSLDGKLLEMAAPGRRLMCVTDFEAIRNADWVTFWRREEDRVAVERALDEARAGGTGRFTGHTPTMDGTPKWWDVEVSPILGSDGKPAQVLAVSRDITAQHETEEQLRRLNDGLEQIVQDRTAALGEAERAGGVGSFEFDLATGITHWSEVLYRIHGVDPAMFTPSYETFLALVHPDDRASIERETAAAIERGGRYEHVKRIVRADGAVRSIETRAEVIRDAALRPARIVGVCTDVTDRLEAANQVEASRRSFETLFDFAPDALVIADAAGNIVRCNRRVERLFGYTANELEGRPVEVLIPDAARTRHVALRASYVESPVARAMGAQGEKLQGLRKDGSIFPVDISLGPMDSPDGPLVAAAIRDVSERVQAESIIRDSLREKETLLKEIHHRVKNNLQIISSLLGMQSDSAADAVSRRLLLESIHRVRSMALIHERLYQSSTLAHIDFGDYARSLTAFLVRSYAAGANVRVVVDAEPVELNIETAVPGGLILNELVSNALKHAYKDGGTGELHVAVARMPTGECSLTVRDSGPGLPAGFDPGKSSALGLQLVTALTRQIKGTLQVLSEGGAYFRITFRELTYANR